MMFRHPTAQDGAEIWRIVRDSGVLDLNSSYCYLLMSHYFSATCLVAAKEPNGQKPAPLAGFVVGFRPPETPEALFVWQVAVDIPYRGTGLGKTMLHRLLQAQPAGEVTYLEATISPSNTASHALFRAVATELEAEHTLTPLFPAEWFPSEGTEEGNHEPEERCWIGPFTVSYRK